MSIQELRGFIPVTHAPSTGRAIVEWYRGLFSALSTLGTLGAGFTLSVVVQDSYNDTGEFAASTIRTWAAISSILFILTVLVCQGCNQVFKFEQEAIAKGVDNGEPCIKHFLLGLSLLLQSEVIGAFLFLEFVLAAHSKVGWIGVGFTTLLALIALSLWGLHAVGKKPVEEYIRVAGRKTKKDTEGDLSN